MYALNNIVLDLKQEGLLQTSECNRMDPPHAHVANTICRSEKQSLLAAQDHETATTPRRPFFFWY